MTDSNTPPPMNQTNTNKRIAEICGFAEIKETAPDRGSFAPRLIGLVDGAKRFVPNYTESLDAMAEAENVLHGLGRWQDYLKSLWKTVNQPPYSCDTITHTENFLAWNFIHATAAQRAAAALAVLEGRGE